MLPTYIVRTMQLNGCNYVSCKREVLENVSLTYLLKMNFNHACWQFGLRRIWKVPTSSLQSRTAHSHMQPAIFAVVLCFLLRNTCRTVEIQRRTSIFTQAFEQKHHSLSLIVAPVAYLIFNNYYHCRVHWLHTLELHRMMYLTCNSHNTL